MKLKADLGLPSTEPLMGPKVEKPPQTGTETRAHFFQNSIAAQRKQKAPKKSPTKTVRFED